MCLLKYIIFGMLRNKTHLTVGLWDYAEPSSCQLLLSISPVVQRILACRLGLVCTCLDFGRACLYLGTACLYYGHACCLLRKCLSWLRCLPVKLASWLWTCFSSLHICWSWFRVARQDFRLPICYSVTSITCSYVDRESRIIILLKIKRAVLVFSAVWWVSCLNRNLIELESVLS